MRNELKKIDGQRMRFTARVERFGHKRAFRGPDIATVLLMDVKTQPEGKAVTDHLWFTRGKSWDGIQPGDVIEFDARVSQYEKGYKGHCLDVYEPVTQDYRLERPTKIVKVA